MKNTIIRKLNMEELEMVTGGVELEIRVKTSVEDDQADGESFAIPRGGKIRLGVRV